MGYVFDFNDAKAYESWSQQPHKLAEVHREHALMLEMIHPHQGETVLDIGCGMAVSAGPFLERGLQVTGIDPSPYMLDLALKYLGRRVDLYRGYAEDLPFDDNSFNYACLVTSLEFVNDPRKALEEACRVAKDHVFIGVLNRYAIKGIQRRLDGLFNASIYNHARFYGIWELKRMIRQITGEVPLSWRTVNQFPAVCRPFTQGLESSRFVQRCPFGAFVGMVITLIPRFRTRPLAMRYRPKHTTGALNPSG
jgi:ubiquinone/menaquinone biosynthesis C-methylase UbiE